MEAEKLMPGSFSGASYYPFARKGNVLLGVKLAAIVDGEAFGVQNATYFALRLRSAPEQGLFSDEKVAKLQKNPPNLWDAWPNVEWEKKSPERASTTVGGMFRGTFKSSEQSQKLLSQVGDGKLAKMMAEKLVKLAGRKNLIVPELELEAWLNSHFSKIFAGVVEAANKKEQIAQAMEESVGTIAIQAAILKKIYGSLPNQVEDVVEDETVH